MIGLIRMSVLRPVGVVLIYLAVALFGLVALRQLAVDLMPAVELPFISITTRWEGVSPEEVETLITRPIEQATSTVEGVERIGAMSSEGLSRVELQFVWGKRLDEALDDVRVAIDRIRARLPDDAETPMVFKFDLSSAPVMFLGLSGTLDPSRLKYMAEDELGRALERVPGVASVDVNGGRDREIRVALDSERLQAHGISAQQVTAALAKENRTVSAGEMRDGGREVILRTAGEFESLKDIEDVVVATRDQRPVLVKDLGEVQDTVAKVRGELWIDGVPGIRLRVYKQSGANSVQVADAVRAEIERINQRYEGRAKLAVLWDSSTFIRSSISNVQSGGLVGALLAAAVLLLFLRNVRATLVVTTAIPLSILATFALMYYRGMTLNIISFGGLALGTGMLVDGAIVILESIYLKRERGLGAVQAAIEGAREVAAPVTSGTLTTVAVFVPVVFVGGFAGVFFTEMALVVTFALFCSLAVALTLVPMLAGLLLRRHSEPSRPALRRLSAAVDGTIKRLECGYSRVLEAVLTAPWVVVGGAAVVLLCSLTLIPRIGVELMPDSDEGQIDMRVDLPVGTPLETTIETMRDIERRVTSVLRPGELSHIITNAGPESWWRPGGSHQGRVDVTLVPVGERQRGIDEVLDAVQKSVDGIAGADIRIRKSTSNMLTRMVRRGDDRLSVEIRGHDLETADALAAQVVQMARTIPGVTFARPDREPGQIERVLHVDRQRAAELGIGSAEVAEAVEHYVLGHVATRYREHGDEFDVRVQLEEPDRERLEQLGSLPIVTRTAQALSSEARAQVPLQSLVRVTDRHAPSAISRVDQERIVAVALGIGSRPASEINAEVQQKLKTLTVPEGFEVGMGGEAEERAKTFSNLLIGLVLAAFLVYAAMAVQFESVRHPLVIIASVPFGFVGVIAALWVTDTTFNMNSFLGTIVLVGIVVNNAIVYVDAANLFRREQGMSLHEALVAAGVRRLRPILMTTLTTALGLLPLALGTSEGSEVQAPLARALLGGLTVSTIVTLVLVPCVYLLAERRRAQPSTQGVEAITSQPAA